MTTPAQSGPDYTRYSLEQLQRARRSIDTERFPERTHLLDVLIADRQQRGEVIPPPPPPEPRHHAMPDPKTPGQALLMMIATVAFLSIVAMIGQPALATHPKGMWILAFLGVLGVLQVVHFLIFYFRLKKQEKSVPPAASGPTLPINASKKNSNTSPIERL